MATTQFWVILLAITAIISLALYRRKHAEYQQDQKEHQKEWNKHKAAAVILESHICHNGFIKSYPPALCSMCRGGTLIWITEVERQKHNKKIKDETERST